MNVFFYEFVLALRRLVRRPVQSGLMLATFTVSITLTLLSWSLFHTMFLRNPEFDPQGTLYRVGLTGGPFFKDGRIASLTRDEVLAWKEKQTVFADFATVRMYESVFVTTENGPERLLSANVSSDALRMLHAVPLMGRLFTTDEDKMGAAPVVLLAEKTWRNRFAANPHIIGLVVNVDNVPTTVVGVMPESFRFPNDQEMWQPQGNIQWEKFPPAMVHDIIVRLKPDITRERAEKDLRVITAGLSAESPALKFELHPVVIPFREIFLFPELNRSSLVLFALAVVFVLVGCANAANLVMIDFFGRAGEIASSLALGIPRAAAIRGLAVQLAFMAGLAALIGSGLLLLVGPHVHQAMARVTTPYWLLFSSQWHHFAMAAGLAVISAGVALIVPVSYLLFVNPERIIRDGAGSSRGSGRGVWRRTLVVGQIALLTVLAISAGLLLRSSYQMRQENWGYDAGAIFQSKLAIKDADFPTPEVRASTLKRLTDELELIPGVSAAALMNVPIGFSGEPRFFYAKTRDGLAEGRSEGGAFNSSVTPDIFKVFGVPFVEGETFAENQKADGPFYVVINQSLANRLWPGESALGREFFGRGASPKQPPFSLVVRGVVRDFQASGPKVTNNDFILNAMRGFSGQAPFLYVRGQASAPSGESVRTAAARVDPRMAVYFPGTMQRTIETELGSLQLTMRLTLTYALAAVLLCAVGVYSITVSQVLQRNREFGIRMALGIDPERLWTRFARGHLIVAALGVVIGIVTAAAVVHVLQALLFGVNARDAVTYAVAAGIILLVSALACIPSLFRLRRINPAECLRSL
ncbi:ABC transporter permease [Oleiharenicola lentus]|uniref:ABC transporter permease n=1 Tax=Oleiharenicola lentus TaxID=2508720 RepID=UPI003F67147B